MSNPSHRPAPLAPQIATGLPLVVTLFYKADLSKTPRLHPDRSAPNSPLPPASLANLTHGDVPTSNIENYPLEPPAPGPEPLDHLYGAYLSQSCLAAFYQTLAELVPDFSEASSWRRNLDSAFRPRVMEIGITLPASTTFTAHSLSKDEAISRFEREWNVELVIQRDQVFRRHKRLAVFDMDSTLIQQEVIDEIARELGVEAEVSAITHAAMNGELDFEASLRKRCALLKGVSSNVFQTLRSKISLTPGADKLIIALKRLGYKTAVLSGGFTPLTGWLATEVLGLDYFHANHLVVSADGKTLTGELEGQIVHAEQKRVHVLDIAQKEGIALEQVFVVGDGANDLPMMGVAGLGIAFNAKARVQLEAPARLNSTSLQDVLYLLGLSKSEQDELLQMTSATR